MAALSLLLMVVGPGARRFLWPAAMAVLVACFVARARVRGATHGPWVGLGVAAVAVACQIVINGLTRVGLVPGEVTRPLVLVCAAVAIVSGGCGSVLVARPLLASSEARTATLAILGLVLVGVTVTGAVSISIRDWQRDTLRERAVAVLLLACAAGLAVSWSWARRVCQAIDRPVEALLVGIPVAIVGGHGLAQLAGHRGPLGAGAWLGPLWACGLALVAVQHPAMDRVGTPLVAGARRVPGIGLVEAIGTMLVLTPVAAWLVTNSDAHSWVLGFGGLLLVGEGTALVWLLRRHGEGISWPAGDQRSRQLERDLPGAFLRGELEMFYQPICRAHDGSLVGAEALARWRHPRLGTLSAAEFVPLVEANGWDDELDDWALRSVIRDGKVVCDAVEGMDAYVTVNISPHQLERPGFVARVTDLLASAGGRADGLVIELTETSAVSDWGQLTANIEALQRLGFFVAVDDFGAGHANLLHLSRLDADIVKLDRDLVVAAVTSGRGLSLVQSSVSLAKSLGVLVVAEGVEEESWAPELARLGVDFIQGYAIGEPRPAATFGL